MGTRLKRQHTTYEIRASGYNYEQIKDGFRNFIIVPDDRKDGYEIGDILIIQKYSYDKRVGEFQTKKVKGFQKRGPGLMRGFIVLGLLDCPDKEEPKKQRDHMNQALLEAFCG